MGCFFLGSVPILNLSYRTDRKSKAKTPYIYPDGQNATGETLIHGSSLAGLCSLQSIPRRPLNSIMLLSVTEAKQRPYKIKNFGPSCQRTATSISFLAKPEETAKVAEDKSSVATHVRGTFFEPCRKVSGHRFAPPIHGSTDSRAEASASAGLPGKRSRVWVKTETQTTSP